MDPGLPQTDNMYLKPPAELDALVESYLPRTVSEAVDAFEDPLPNAVSGDLMAKT